MTYSFLTTKSFRIDVVARSPKQGFKLAQKELEKVWASRGVMGGKNLAGELSGTYFKYDKDGLHAINGAYYQI